MQNETQKPTPEAKALSLFLMALKSTNPIYKEKSKRINRLWSLVQHNEMSQEEYMKEVNETLGLYGGYDTVIEKTVKHYIDKTGEWKLTGDDKYSIDTKKVADKLTT